MKLRLLTALLAATPAFADLQTARELLRQDAAKAVEHLRELLAQKPGDPWLLYDAGVAAYAAKDFSAADEAWQQLASTTLPDELREQVWLQIGNVSYRLAQPQINSQPDSAIARLEQSREAYRVVLAFQKGNKPAAQNLAVVEKDLENIYARLAKQLVQEAKKNEWDLEKTIERLQAALTYAQQAQALNPKDAEREQEKKEIEKLLAQAFDRKAASHEKSADQRKTDNEWERQTAQEQWQKALENFQQAQAASPEDQAAKDGEKRVQKKLADSFDKSGRKQQQEARQSAKADPQDAAEKFEKAIENFQESLAHMPEHADAQAGEKEAKAELEKLHLENGDRQAKRGEDEMENAPEQAARDLLGALDHFEQAKRLDPANPTIPPRIEKVQGELSPLLTQLGQQEQQQGEKQERLNSPQEAVEHFEKAETDFAKAEDIQPGNDEAKQGRKESKEALARLRQRLAERGQQPGKPQPGKEEAKESFESMLAKLKDQQKRDDPRARHHAGQKYEQDRKRTLRDW